MCRTLTDWQELDLTTLFFSSISQYSRVNTIDHFLQLLEYFESLPSNAGCHQLLLPVGTSCLMILRARGLG